jgi:hypothetical protein
MENIHSKSFQKLYEGSLKDYKVGRLQESTGYRFRIRASNDAGEGDFSQEYEFYTCKAPPHQLKAPKICDISETKCSASWEESHSCGDDKVLYQLQLCRQQDLQVLYRGEETSFQLKNLSHNTDYSVRVCAIRVCGAESSMAGPYSPHAQFHTSHTEKKPVLTQRVHHTPQVEEKSESVSRTLTDEQFAWLILFGLVLLGVFLALVVQQFLDWNYRTSN